MAPIRVSRLDFKFLPQELTALVNVRKSMILHPTGHIYWNGQMKKKYYVTKRWIDVLRTYRKWIEWRNWLWCDARKVHTASNSYFFLGMQFNVCIWPWAVRKAAVWFPILVIYLRTLFLSHPHTHTRSSFVRWCASNKFTTLSFCISLQNIFASKFLNRYK